MKPLFHYGGETFYSPQDGQELVRIIQTCLGISKGKYSISAKRGWERSAVGYAEEYGSPYIVAATKIAVAQATPLVIEDYHLCMNDTSSKHHASGGGGSK